MDQLVLAFLSAESPPADISSVQEKEYFAAEYDLQQIEENAQQEEAEKNKAQAKPKKSVSCRRSASFTI
jgi:hypothetical protein